MKLSDLSESSLRDRLAGEGLTLRIAPVAARIRSEVPAVAEGLRLHYADYELLDGGAFCDFHIRISPPANLRRWFRRQVRFLHDGISPFEPMPWEHAFPVFEWGLNWCMANHFHQYLMIHAAVIERADGRAAILAAPPGSGKSTLCAGLVARGWRLLSDELALIDPRALTLTPIPRPISLKNESIEVIRRFAPAAVLGSVSHDTHKGAVAHIKPPRESVRRAAEKARAAWIVFPRYQAGAPAEPKPFLKARTVLRLAENAFNYAAFGETGFRALVGLADACGCYEFSYGDLGEAVRVFDALPAGER
ncbi:MAG: HprK-related kinase A [Rhodocyclales bacterium CG_4_9_14_3_um_filter_68_10]|nr:MAG: HprK-related kinase A [Rhodocyclales bacterium CG_4_9_14_3_um_filter_68_10]